MKLILVATGGAIGATLRYGVGHLALRLFGPSFPYGTLFVNVFGSFVMGLFIGSLARGWLDGSDSLRLFVATGLLGGFTTFSAFSLDAATLYERGAFMAMSAYVIGSVALSLAAVFAGLALARVMS